MILPRISMCLMALHFTNEAWDKDSDVFIRNCFRHGSFVETEEEEGDDRSIETQEGLTDKTYEDWMNIDHNL